MKNPEVSVALVTLLQGPLHAEDDPAIWRTVTSLGGQLAEQLESLGLRLVVDETDRFAYLQQLEELPEGMVRLQRRHALTRGSTILLILLRQQLASAESDPETAQVVVTSEQMVEWAQLYRRREGDERTLADINTLVRLGYLRRLRGRNDTFEVRRIIKAIVTADWLNEYRDRLLTGDDDTADAEGDGDDTEVVA